MQKLNLVASSGFPCKIYYTILLQIIHQMEQEHPSQRESCWLWRGEVISPSGSGSCEQRKIALMFFAAAHREAGLSITYKNMYIHVIYTCSTNITSAK